MSLAHPMTASPFPIPGGWETRIVTVCDREFELALPANPDAFLDDPATIAEHQRTDYMPYWPYLWPSAEKMATLVLHANWPQPQRVLEIGCGIGLVGLAALARGDSVTFTDYRSEAVDLAVENARRNGFPDVAGLQLDIRQPIAEQYPVVLGCDVIYERALHRPVLSLIRSMLEPHGVCWLGDPGRHAAEEFADQAAIDGFDVSIRNAAGEPCIEQTSGEFRLIELRRVRRSEATRCGKP